MSEGLAIGAVVCVIAFAFIFITISAWDSFERVPLEIWESSRLERFRLVLKRLMKPHWLPIPLMFPVSVLLSIFYIVILWPRLREVGATQRPRWPWEAERVPFPEGRRWILAGIGAIAVVVALWWLSLTSS